MSLTALREWTSATLDFVYPPLCLGCEVPRELQSIFCERCSGAVSYLDHPLCLNCLGPIETGTTCSSCRTELPLFALGDHIGPLQQAVIGLKFRQVRRVAEWAAAELCGRLGKRIAELKATALVPVPLHPRREYFRGFNQAELFAEKIADCLDLDLRCDLAARAKHRGVQSRISGTEQRLANVKGVFSPLVTADNCDRLLIVDDVVTSGATVGELARVLNAAGHKVVGVLAIAHRG